MMPTEIKDRLSAVGMERDADVDIAEAALLLGAATRPGVPLDPYRRHLEKVVREVATLAGDDPALDLQAQALSDVIARRYGYIGAEDAFEDLESANLTRVIDRRTGLPVAIGIVYLKVAGDLGWDMVGIDFPARFLLRLEHAGERAIVDPFDAGRLVTPVELRDLFKAVAGQHAELKPGYFRAMTKREVLLRLENNVKIRLLRQDRLEDALHHVETMLLFAPEVALLWREAGLINARLDNVKAAVAALEEFMRRDGDDTNAYRTSVLLQELRARLN